MMRTYFPRASEATIGPDSPPTNMAARAVPDIPPGTPCPALQRYGHCGANGVVKV